MSVTLPYRGIVPPLHRRLQGNLAAGADLSSGTSKSEVICIAGCARVRAYVQASIAGTLKLQFVQPVASDGAIDGSGAIDVTKVTAYTSSKPADIPVTANTEAEIHADVYGEAFVMVTFAYTATGSATLTFCDMSAV